MIIRLRKEDGVRSRLLKKWLIDGLYVRTKWFETLYAKNTSRFSFTGKQAPCATNFTETVGVARK